MRVSASESDPDFWAQKSFASGKCSVVLDGAMQTDVVEADEDKGYVDRCVRDAKGALVAYPRSGRIQIERVYGQVTIVPFSLL